MLGLPKLPALDPPSNCEIGLMCLRGDRQKQNDVPVSPIYCHIHTVLTPLQSAPPVNQRRRFLTEFFRKEGFGKIPNIPDTNRTVEDLRVEPNVWKMSRSERRTLYDMWSAAAGESIRETQFAEFENLRQQHEAARQRFEEIKEQVSCCSYFRKSQ